MYSNDVLKLFCSFEFILGKFIKILLWDFNKEFCILGKFRIFWYNWVIRL